jgi:hypothetical protein
MKFIGLVYFGLVLFSFCLAKQGKKGSDGFISLFNGKDLTHWQTTGNWLPQKDGSLLIQPKSDQKGWQRYSDYLISKKNSGILSSPLNINTPPRETVDCFSVLGIQKIRSKPELNAKFSTRSVSRITKWVTMITEELSVLSERRKTCRKTPDNGTE